MKTDLEKVKKLAKDLRKGYPRSPREKLGSYVIAARCVDWTSAAPFCWA